MITYCKIHVHALKQNLQGSEFGSHPIMCPALVMFLNDVMKLLIPKFNAETSQWPWLCVPRRLSLTKTLFLASWSDDGFKVHDDCVNVSTCWALEAPSVLHKLFIAASLRLINCSSIECQPYLLFHRQERWRLDSRVLNLSRAFLTLKKSAKYL